MRGMNRRMRALLLTVAGLLSAACQQTAPSSNTPAEGAESTAIAEKPEGYTALPGRAATSSTPTETTTAFEIAAAAYNAQPSSASPASRTARATSSPTVPTTAHPPLPISIPATVPSAPPIPDPRPVRDSTESSENTSAPAKISSSAPSVGAATISAGESMSRTTSDTGGYAVQVTNGTSGRLFVEMHDDSGNIFPFGFMYAGQRIASRPQAPRPIKGRLTLVIRDPDQPSAPELRRYHVDAPPHYLGHTLGITILPGGRYRTAVDGKVYYTSPEPGQPTPAQ